ncbi:hypothetical protein RCO27_03100 [Sphingosinicella sp. LHD-64]|uniref:hypothetical protein n=1 Tax=Sphingosinicella sp. LHD-64 TaxID=3072139 RepID=UPI00280F728E|nr:hypothetical protein [Sphingosinicella sp. LHD-64]MDQ8755208.1 hypothetical protein [Sphingosinicella sp. LHD-64]
MLVLAYLLLAGGDEPPPAPTPPPPAPAAVPTPPSAPAPPLAPVSSPEGLRLFGVTGAGAIIGGADGRQRLIRLGRDVLPGLRLEAVRVDHALLKSAAGGFRLDFTGVTATAPAAAPSAAPGAVDEAAVRADVQRYLLAFEPRRVGTRVTSHALKAGQTLPVLQRAGLRAGDVVLRVNDSEFDQERLMDLAWTIANSDRVVFEVERGGQRMSLAAEGAQSR